MAEHDTTASIDYILEKTQYNQLQYIGYSQGSTLFFMMCSMFPLYQRKISLVVGLSPAVFLGNSKHPLIIQLHNHIDNMLWITKKLGIYEIHPGRDIFRIVGPTLCPLPGISIICQLVINAIAGSNPEQFNLKYISNIVANAPEGTGMLHFAHLLQLTKTDKFRKFDYGFEENMKRYGLMEPPHFSLKDIDIPIALYYSENDLLVPQEGVEKLSKVLFNVVDFYKVKDKKFTHLDFVFANDIVSLLYNRVLNLMDRYKI